MSAKLITYTFKFGVLKAAKATGVHVARRRYSDGTDSEQTSAGFFCSSFFWYVVQKAFCCIVLLCDRIIALRYVAVVT